MKSLGEMPRMPDIPNPSIGSSYMTDMIPKIHKTGFFRHEVCHTLYEYYKHNSFPVAK